MCTAATYKTKDFYFGRTLDTKIERGEGNPTIEVLEKILDTLGLELQIGIKQRNEL